MREPRTGWIHETGFWSQHTQYSSPFDSDILSNICLIIQCLRHVNIHIYNNIINIGEAIKYYRDHKSVLIACPDPISFLPQR